MHLFGSRSYHLDHETRFAGIDFKSVRFELLNRIRISHLAVLCRCGRTFGIPQYYQQASVKSSCAESAEKLVD